MPALDLIDETFVVAPPERVAAACHDTARWARWWPGLTLTVFMDRGEKGVRWSATGPAVGSLEVWLEPWGDGVVVHHYVRLDPTEAGSSTTPRALPTTPAGWRAVAAERARYATAWKRHVWALKDELEAGRPAGAPVRTAPVGPGAAGGA